MPRRVEFATPPSPSAGLGETDRLETLPAAEPSAAAKKKKQQRQSDDGLPLHSFSPLLAALGTRRRNTCRTTFDCSGTSFQLLTAPTPLQACAVQLLGL